MYLKEIQQGESDSRQQEVLLACKASKNDTRAFQINQISFIVEGKRSLRDIVLNVDLRSTMYEVTDKRHTLKPLC